MIYTNAPQCYVIRTLSVLLKLQVGHISTCTFSALKSYSTKAVPTVTMYNESEIRFSTRIISVLSGRSSM